MLPDANSHLDFCCDPAAPNVALSVLVINPQCYYALLVRTNVLRLPSNVYKHDLCVQIVYDACATSMRHVCAACASPARRMRDTCTTSVRPCVMHVSYTCRTLVVHVSYTFRTYVVHMSYICRTLVVHLSYTCRTLVVHLSSNHMVACKSHQVALTICLDNSHCPCEVLTHMKAITIVITQLYNTNYV